MCDRKCTHADTAEVERLRTENEDYGRQVVRYEQLWNDARRERDTLRADLETMRRKNNEYWHESEAIRTQLAEAQALLRTAMSHGVYAIRAGDGKSVGDQIKDYLSASAEPSAPVEIDERGSGSLEFDKLLAEYHAILWASGEDGEVDYDLAGIGTAKKLQALHRAALARKP